MDLFVALKLIKSFEMETEDHLSTNMPAILVIFVKNLVRLKLINL